MPPPGNDAGTITPHPDAGGGGARHDASAGGGATDDAGDGTDNGATGSTSGCAIARTSAPTETGFLGMVGVFGAAIVGAARRRRNRS
jgi:hypothetical protein